MWTLEGRRQSTSSLPAKLGAAIAVIILVLIGATSLANIQRIAVSDQLLTRESTAPMVELSRLAVAFQHMRVISRDMLAADNEQDFGTFEARLAEFLAQTESLSEQYQCHNLSPSERQTFAELEAARNVYLAELSELDNLARQKKYRSEERR